MRVLMLSLHTSPLAQPGSGDAGGMNVYVRQLAENLGRQGAQVRIISTGDQGDLELAPGVLVQHLAVPAPRSKEALPQLLPELIRRISDVGSGGAEILHSHYWISGMAGLELARIWQLPLVHTMHTMAKVKDRHRTGGQLAEPSQRAAGEDQIVAAADRLIANTQAEAVELNQLYGGCSDRISVVPPGVDLEVFRAGPKLAAAGADQMLLVFAGRLQRLKGPHILLGALAQLRDRRPELAVRLVVIGSRSGAQDYDLATLRRELGLEAEVDFLPPMPAAELASWFRSADAVAMPSSSESFGLVALEAQACGTPVLATRVGGLNQAVRDGVTGLLVDDLDESSWARAIEQLHDLGPAARARMGEAGIAHAASHSWVQTARRTRAVYDAVLAASR
ncbi:glycosyltransferase [Arthrobacter russicus]|jgi:D-inositol-3-phosphate glycosyltransferase|uniref:D-inositol 3-phosphate glycosyltransferase n=1 Tax=Arthrobacter russicus TaxID=172040 RepID=A0ABU1JDP6_9MICC|nr:glycosyltransferase [Arthrobacter russicus]MDN5668824.1 glycosyltransferase [Renibacterium salmoninarum]MDR6270530.1 D-inositol-3-phosphate glycosyltransferase [Arthrobacter russicus]